MEKVVLPSLAKINLGLEVLGSREDGYHEIITLFQTVGIADRVKFSLRSDGKIIITGNRSDVPWDESNLISRAARLLQQESGCPCGTEVKVAKNIPPGRGLGGGSSNAAVTLIALNRLWQVNFSLEQLVMLGASLGADVPYFFYGGLCLGRGKGDRLEQLSDPGARWMLLAIPDFAVSTAAIYGEFDKEVEFLTSRDKASKIIQFFETEDQALIRHLENELEFVAFKIHPQLAEIKKALLESGAELSLMSGSGSAVYGLFVDKAKARRAARKLASGYQVCLAETVNRELYRQMLITGA